MFIGLLTGLVNASNYTKYVFDASAKNIMYVKKTILRMSPATYSCKNGKYLASITENSVITICETKILHILLASVLMTIVLFIALSVYCHLIKYRVKQKHLLPFHVANNKLKELYIDNIN